MTDLKHTPGPWTASVEPRPAPGRGHWYVVLDAEENGLGEFYGEDHETNEANLRLACEAPTMLARITALEAEIAGLGARLRETQMLLVKHGDHESLRAAAKTWPEAERAFEGRCLKCGGLHLGMAGDCMGPPVPSRPHPFAGRMQG